MLNDLSARFYVIQSLYQWCLDKGHTPHLLIEWNKREDNSVLEQYVVSDRVILNISPVSVKDLNIEEKGVSFTARFSNKVINIQLYYQEIIAIYAKETDQYFAFPKLDSLETVPEVSGKKRPLKKRNTPSPLSLV